MQICSECCSNGRALAVRSVPFFPAVLVRLMLIIWGSPRPSFDGLHRSGHVRGTSRPHEEELDRWSGAEVVAAGRKEAPGEHSCLYIILFSIHLHRKSIIV